MKKSLLSLSFVCLVIGFIRAETIYFKAEDGLNVAAELYMAHENTAPFIVLFHQANWSRGEYAEIAPKLNSMGFNCMAVDLRSGGSVNGIENITKINAIKAMKETRYVDALPDMIGAIKHARKNFVEGKLIIWGSSYSSALSIKLAGEMSDYIDAVLAFSPGEYFISQGKPRDYITSSAIKITCPVFITSAKNEKNGWWGIYVAISSDVKKYFLPESQGVHGARALWEKNTDAKAYWDAVNDFLADI